MNEFRGGDQLWQVLHFFLEPVLHRFHVMVGDGFNRLDTGGVCFSEISSQLVE